ncbi:hypothetical protein F2Q69_00030505 [Brassica cretica]|uniref:NAC domain-containing protein n=1 Tax=Brassica cretica TaxID=69181 RepID=A0A8S9S314_BRACR|nr:hypothetical protein F2Q69_00030505 [Brassica cretica]
MKNYPVGFRSSPMDEELINFYQKNKFWVIVGSLTIRSARSTSIATNQRFCLKRPRRTTRSGFWKVTGVDRKIEDKGTLDLLFPRESSPVRDSPNFIPSNPPPPLGRHSSLPRLTVRSAVTSVRSFNPFPSLRNTEVFVFALFLAKMNESILKAARY